MTLQEYTEYTNRVRQFIDSNTLGFFSLKNESAFYSSLMCDVCQRPLCGDRYEMTAKTKDNELFEFDACPDCMYFLHYFRLPDEEMLGIDREAQQQIIRELDRRGKTLQDVLTLQEIEKKLNSIGYELDHDLDCFSYATDLATQEQYPAISAGCNHIETGLSFAHNNAPRDENYRTLQTWRYNSDLCAIVNGALFEV